MAKSSIEWTDEVWNPVTGCTRASSGCDFCYAVRMSYRLENMGQEGYKGLTVVNGKGDRHFNGVVRCHEDRLTIPLGWKKPRRCFVNSMSDLFHKDVPFDFIDKVFAVMALTPHITYQVLTKRPERMAEYFAFADKFINRIGCVQNQVDFRQASRAGWPKGRVVVADRWPLPNVWLGTSVENQETANERIPHLLDIPAAVRFLSCEPLIGPVDLNHIVIEKGEDPDGEDDQSIHCFENCSGDLGIHWVICGGESGPKARPMHLQWAQSLRDQCVAAGVPFFFKQWGEWCPASEEYGVTGCVMPETGEWATWLGWDGKTQSPSFHGLKEPIMAVARQGKKIAGRLLDGRTWDEFPEVAVG